jgi:hypothetical protein
LPLRRHKGDTRHHRRLRPNNNVPSLASPPLQLNPWNNPSFVSMPTSRRDRLPCSPPSPPHRHMGNTRHHRCPRPNATVVFSCLATAIAQPLEQLMRWRGRWQRGNRSLLDVGIDADDELVAASHVVASALLLCDVHCRYCVPSHREHKARSSTWATHQQQHRWPHNQCRVTDNLV